MDVFDIIGPVMIGPSSSHTAGAVRIGKMARTLLGEKPVDATIKLHGSFANTYKGHGSDRALIGGLLGMLPDDADIRKSLQLAAKEGMRFGFESINIKDAHPNTVLIEVVGQSGKKISVQGSSIGGGNIVIKKINNLEVEFTAQYHTLIVMHRDTPGAVAVVTDLLAYSEINIAQMKVYRSARGGDAIMVIETDQPINKEMVTKMGSLPHITNVTMVEPV